MSVVVKRLDGLRCHLVAYGGRPRPGPQTVVCAVCFVCDVGVLWPNGWIDQDETWHGGDW